MNRNYQIHSQFDKILIEVNSTHSCVRERDNMCTFKFYKFKSCGWFLSLRTGCFFVAVAQLIVLLITNVFAEFSLHPVAIVGNLVVLTFIGYLIFGTVKENHTQLRWWTNINNSLVVLLAALFSFCFFGFILVIVTMQLPSQLEPSQSGEYALLMVFLIVGAIAGLIFTIQGIFSWIVYSYMCELRELDDRKNANEKEIGGTEMLSLVPI